MEKEFLLKRWPKIRTGLMSVVEGFNDEDLHFVPVKGGWPVGRLILHISSAADHWLHSGILSDVNIYQRGQSTLEYYPDLPSIKSYLAKEHERTMVLLQSFDPAAWDTPYTYPRGEAYTPAWIFWHVLEHEIHHRGELSLSLGLLGRLGLNV